MKLAKAKMWSKGQTLIPREVRQVLDLKPGDEIEFELEALKNEIRIIMKKKGTMRER